AHPLWFVNDSTGEHPYPFTMMRCENGEIIGSTIAPDGGLNDIGKYRTVKQAFYDWTINYLQTLSNSGRYPHMIWPYHCLIGTPGHNIVAPLFDAVLQWERNNVGFAIKLTKGSNFKTEHFSAVMAEVPDPSDETTQLNTDFISLFEDADEILLAGEARSHCLANTVMDIANQFDDDSFIKKCILLEDATSDVPGLEHLGETFVKDMTVRGMRVVSCADYS
ncbi:MAG: cysteine hydrolase, partial [Petrotogales bacterium]